MKRLVLITLAAFSLLACESNKEEQTTDVCSTNNVTYNATIAPMINAHGCLGCHNSTSLQGGFSLENYDLVKTKATQTRSGTSVLYGALSHSSGFAPMPQGMAMLSSCEIAKVKTWVDNGMPQ